MGQGKDSGVWGHSGAHGSASYIIFAIDDTSIAGGAQFRDWMTQHKIGFKALIGCYKGVTEQSYIINANDWAAVYETRACALQESILELGPCTARDKRPAKLIYQDWVKRPAEDIGFIQSVPEVEAKEYNSWSYDPQSKQYFICKQDTVYKQCPHCQQWSDQ